MSATPTSVFQNIAVMLLLQTLVKGQRCFQYQPLWKSLEDITWWSFRWPKSVNLILKGSISWLTNMMLGGLMSPCTDGVLPVQNTNAFSTNCLVPVLPPHTHFLCKFIFLIFLRICRLEIV